MKKFLIITILLLVTCFSFPQKNYYVSKDGTGNFSTIAQVNSALLMPGDIVSFKSGQQFSDATLNCKAGVTYTSYGTGKAILGDSLSYLNPTVTISANNVKIDNLKIYGSRTVSSDIIKIYDIGKLTITNCEIVGGEGGHEINSHGIRTVGANSDSLVIQRNIFRDITVGAYLRPYKLDFGYNELYNLFTWRGSTQNSGIGVELHRIVNNDAFDANYSARIHHNNFHHFEGGAIGHIESKILIEYNEIHHNLDDRVFLGGCKYESVGKLFDNTNQTLGGIGTIFRYNYVHDIHRRGKAGEGYSHTSKTNMLAGIPQITYNTGLPRPIYYNVGSTTDHYGDEGYEHHDALINGMGYGNIWIHNNIFYNISYIVFSRGYTRFSTSPPYLGGTGTNGFFRKDLPSYFLNNTLFNCSYDTAIVYRGSIFITNESQSPTYIENNIINIGSLSSFPAVLITEQNINLSYNIFTNRGGLYVDKYDYTGGKNNYAIALGYNATIDSIMSPNYYYTDPQYTDSTATFWTDSIGVSGVYLPDLRIVNGGNAYNKGVDLGSDPTGRSLKYDAIGRLRTTNDIGALGTSTSSQPSPTGLKILLEAPYENGKMRTTLNSSKLLPLSQPYNVSPWNIVGDITISGTLDNYVDWILVQVRNDLTTTIYYKVGILTEDGTVLNPDGSPFSFANLPTGDYYLVIRHRNHLAVMTSKKIPIEKNKTVNYDFTDSQSKAYGENAMAKLSDGRFAMLAGDGDANGVVNVLDFSTVANNILFRGYAQGDIDMNGTVNILDYAKINQNLFKRSFVP